ncbi:hypothetical protein EVAR_94637_1 [Eumeta japonica]|uniref:Histone-lysine N-methyltransferase SETMAR n=1 Tax=Eumeta variegata TaxID=151549 RepID=A0A4C1UUU9_EUMVA|nr:hypothetical protein EVAR_94637_1 [Eumeta japonica]
MEDFSRSGRLPACDIEITKEAIENQPSTGTRRLLASLGPSKDTVHRQLKSLDGRTTTAEMCSEQPIRIGRQCRILDRDVTGSIVSFHQIRLHAPKTTLSRRPGRRHRVGGGDRWQNTPTTPGPAWKA